MTGPAILVLEDGYHQAGSRYGAAGATTGEIVFATGMTGYQETFTDPSYHRQIVVMTAPHIGNTGMNAEDSESDRLWVAGLVVRDPARRASNWRSTGELEDHLVREGVVGIAGVDTRAITRHLRDAGVMRAGIFSGAELQGGVLTGEALATLVERVRESPAMLGAHLTDDVSTPEPYVVGTRDAQHVVVAVDLGIKSRTPEQLAERGCRVHVVPHTTSIEEILALRPDGVFFSNGPGDPAGAEREVALLREVLEAGLPFFGICFGNQLLGRALGFGTYKLPFGHRGVNQPVRELPEGTVQITTHNHGFAVDVPVGEAIASPYEGGRFGRVEVSHVSLNDGVVEGLRCLDIPAFSVQYHPEAAAGPHDGEHLFDRFVQLMRTRGPRAGKDGR